MRKTGKALAKANRHAWAHAGVGGCIVASAYLNGYANSLHSPHPWTGAILGAFVPTLVFILARVAGLQWRAGRRGLAQITAGSGGLLLLLSVWHCALSLAILTGSHIALALPMAIAVDCGLVACELETVLG
jgi:hypothetical protein